MRPSDVIEDFFDAFRRRGHLFDVRMPDTPREMIVRERKGGWFEWRLMPQATNSIERYAAFEKRNGMQLPPLFKQWHSRYFTLSVDTGMARIAACPLNNPFRDLDQYVCNEDRANDLGLLPFGDEGMMDAGPLCFDPRGGGNPDGWPIVYWDHEYDGQSNEISRPIFSNFEAMLRCCTEYMRTPQENRKIAIARFLEIDSAGAGDTGRNYWQTWF